MGITLHEWAKNLQAKKYKAVTSVADQRPRAVNDSYFREYTPFAYIKELSNR